MLEVTIEKILDVINYLDNMDITPEQINEKLEDLGMDSITFIQIVVKLEEVFDCEIPDSKLLITEMDTVQKIFNVLQELYEEQASKV